MKGTVWVQILVSFKLAVGQFDQYQSYVGCFNDDKNRDLKQWKKNIGKGKYDPWTLIKCRKWAKQQNKKYFSLQFGVSCAISNEFNTKKNYGQIPNRRCIRNGYTCGNSEHIHYCGGPWANALYTTKPIATPPMVKANQWMQINSPWKNWACMCTLYKTLHVYMHGCDERNHGMTAENFLWKWDKKTGRVLNKRWGGKCLDSNMRSYTTISMQPCHNHANQKWYWRFGHHLTSKQSGYNLEWNAGNNQVMARSWNAVGSWKSVQDPWGFDKSGPKRKTKANERDWEKQAFWWNVGQPLKIKGGTKGGRQWLSVTHDGKKVDLSKVNGNRQKWLFFQREDGWYNIMLTGSMIRYRKDLTLNNMYLSVTKDGKKMDLSNTDDGSGRQRWKINKLKDGHYNILVKCFEKKCVNGTKRYLSTTESGATVDLWMKDDKSGRQRWKLFDDRFTPKPTPRPTPNPTPVPVRNLISGGGWKIIKVKGERKCTISIENGVKYPCAVSPNYPKIYGREHKCQISMSKKTEYVTLQGSTEKYFDFLTLAGKQFSGKLKGKKVKVKGKLSAEWTADFFEGTRGWKFCKAQPPRLKIIGRKRKDKKNRKIKKFIKNKKGKRKKR